MKSYTNTKLRKKLQNKGIIIDEKKKQHFDKYIDVVNEMYEDNVLDDDDIEDLDLSKEKDDYER